MRDWISPTKNGRRSIDRYANSAAGAPFIVQHYCTPHRTMALPLRGEESDYTAEPQPYTNLSGLYLLQRPLHRRLQPPWTRTGDFQEDRRDYCGDYLGGCGGWLKLFHNIAL